MTFIELKLVIWPEKGKKCEYFSKEWGKEPFWSLVKSCNFM